MSIIWGLFLPPLDVSVLMACMMYIPTLKFFLVCWSVFRWKGRMGLFGVLVFGFVPLRI